MARLTERFSNGQAASYGCGSNCKYDHKYCRENLENCPAMEELLEKLAHYEDLEEAGRLVELPCKVGETVYCIVNKKILSGYVKRIRPFIGGDYIDIMLDVEFTIVDPFYHDGRMTTFAQVASFDSRAYCTIAYHTHEEAEAALKGAE